MRSIFTLLSKPRYSGALFIAHLKINGRFLRFIGEKSEKYSCRNMQVAIIERTNK